SVSIGLPAASSRTGGISSLARSGAGGPAASRARRSGAYIEDPPGPQEHDNSVYYARRWRSRKGTAGSLLLAPVTGAARKMPWKGSREGRRVAIGALPRLTVYRAERLTTRQGF